MTFTKTWDERGTLELVRKCVSRQLSPGAPLPRDEDDLVKTGLIDSMAWVGILTAIEEEIGIRNFGSSWPEGCPQSIRALADTAREARGETPEAMAREKPLLEIGEESLVGVKGWGYALGSLTVEAEQVERELGLPAHTIRERAGIQTVRRAAQGEDELTLGQEAAEAALGIAQAEIEDVDFLLATSTTFLNLPCLAPALHSRLLLREASGALDVGGACVGVINALAVARALLETSCRGVALVVASEVHSRRLASPQVPGEFRGLFGDGACAFVLARSEQTSGHGPVKLGDFVWGCSGTFASSLRFRLGPGAGMEIDFNGEQLARAAVTQLDHVISTLENQTGRPRTEVDYFAIHEPNPRVIEILALKAKIPLEKIPLLSRTCGNLGSAACGVSLCHALTSSRSDPTRPNPPLIFLAAVAPGLIWGGTHLS